MHGKSNVFRKKQNVTQIWDGGNKSYPCKYRRAIELVDFKFDEVKTENNY